MRRSGGHYGGDAIGSNPYSATQMNHHHHHQQQQQHKSEHYQNQNQNQWRWERDESKLSSPMSPRMPSEDMGSEAPRSYYEGQRLDPRMAMEKRGNSDAWSQRYSEDMDIGYEDNAVGRTFEGLEQKFLDDMMKLSKEQSDAEDAENARHRERINAINVQYQDQLVALRSRHSNRRDEFLRKESQARQQKYQQAALDDYPLRGTGTSNPHSYNEIAAPAAESQRAYDSGSYDAYRERPRFAGNTRDHGFEPRVPYPSGRSYDSGGSRYN